MLSTSIGSCLCARLRNIWRKPRRGGLWCSFVFILIFCLLPTLDIPAPRHHGAVEDFSVLHKRERSTPLSREETKVARGRRIVRLFAVRRRASLTTVKLL